MELTVREYEIAEYVTKDLSQKMIASRLFISPGTVKTHVDNIKRKWGVSTSIGIAVKYLQSLDFPKKFVLASFFLCIQAVMIFENPEMNLRKLKTSSKTVKVRRNEA
jgi:DNA-binding CsgD family transcriptional regulator